MTSQIVFHSAQFRDDLSPESARELFRLCVQFVEIETFTYCNRKCWFCPNAAMPERQDRAANRYMPETLYLRILEDLASVNYGGQIQFGRYNEPLADRIILMRIQQARETCPNAFLYTHTNGDYLTRPYLDELRAAGLNCICLQSYLGNNESWDVERMRARQAQQLRRLGLGVAQTIEDSPTRLYSLTNYPGLSLTIDARDFAQIGTDRGGLVPVNVSQRTAPCFLVFSNLYVDCDGSTVPCCNIRSDRPEHAAYVVSRLQDGVSIFHAYAALHGWRRSLLRFRPKNAPCDTCAHEVGAFSEEKAGELEAIYEQLVEAQ